MLAVSLALSLSLSHFKETERVELKKDGKYYEGPEWTLACLCVKESWPLGRRMWNSSECNKNRRKCSCTGSSSRSGKRKRKGGKWPRGRACNEDGPL